MGFFDTILGGSSNDKVQEMLNDGAVIIDVRTAEEFNGGHVAGSQNFPLHELGSNLRSIKEIGKPLVLCCASGNRSGQAADFLKSKGLVCENGGGWMQVNGMVY